MTWEQARTEAGKLVDRMQFRNADLAGNLIEIAPIMERCSHVGKDRDLIEQAVGRS